MSLKRLLNDDDSEYYAVDEVFAPRPTTGFQGYVDLTSDVPTHEEQPSSSLNDVFGELLNSPFGNGDQIAAMNNVEATDNSDYDLGQGLEEWAATLSLSSDSSPSTQNSQTTPSLAADSSAASSDGQCSSNEDEELTENVCYGMIHRVDVKLVGEMAVIDKKLDQSDPATIMQYQRFTLTEQPDHILLSFKDDGTDFGYLRSNMNKALDKLLSQQGVQFEAVAPTRTLRETIGRAKKASEAMVKVDINIYGPKSMGSKVGDRLSSCKLWLQRPEHFRRGSPYHNPHFLAFKGMNQLEVEVQREVARGGPARGRPRGDQLRQMMMDVYSSLGRGRHINRVNGSSKLTKDLLPHQKEALGFMLERESGAIQEDYRLWQPKVEDDQVWYYHKITKSRSRLQPDEKGGGILADEMGMGKSLSILALIVQTLEDGQNWAEQQRTSDDTNKSLKYSRSTLVVVSSALLINNWSNEIRMHLDGSLKVIRYHGPGRETNLNEIEDSDIVVTTYNTLSAEFAAHSSILHKIGWYRVVLDEAHIIRRQATTFHRTCADLIANSRWCLTGTPIQNKLADIGALFAFIKARPFDSIAVFRRYIEVPFEQHGDENPEKVKERLVMLLDSLCLRRTKELLELPGLKQRVQELEFTREEREQYSKTQNILQRIIKQRVGELEKNSKFGLFQANLQMRILCNHGTFQQPFSWQRRSYRDEREAAVCAIGQSTEITCSGCQQPMPILGSNKIYNSFVEVCNHVLCSECLNDTNSSTAERQRQHCPVCVRWGKTVHSGTPVPTSTVSGGEDVEMTDASKGVVKGEEDDDNYFRQEGHSTKMRALIRDVKEDLFTTKSIIFSCWTRTLSLVAKHLDDAKVPYLRIDGDCPLPKRQRKLDDFASDDNMHVLIMTTGTGAFGLNLTCANRVFIVELQWNPSVENQAIARAIRLGQGKEVLVTRYVIKNSVEEEMRSQQRWKLKIAEMGFEP